MIDKELAERSPGPTTASMKIKLPSINEHNKSISLGTSIVDESSYRNRFDDSKKIFFKELELDV